MARRKQRPAPSREFKIRLPEDIAQRVEAKAKSKGWPQNRVIINELAAYPDLEKVHDLATLVGEMENTLSRYGARIAWHDISEHLLEAVDAVLNAQGGAQQAALDNLRVMRNAMMRMKRE